MARIEFLDTQSVRSIGVAGRVVPLPLQPSLAAMAKTARYFEADATTLQIAERMVALVWDALIRSGAKPTIHQVAMLVDSTGIPDEMRGQLGGDFVVHSEPGDPGAGGDDDEPGGEDGGDEERPTGPAAVDVAGPSLTGG